MNNEGASEDYPQDDYEYLLQETEKLYDIFGDLSIETLDYMIYVCEVIIESKLWQQGE